MNLYQRAGSILAREGVSGLCRRTVNKIFPSRPKRYDPNAIVRARAEYEQLVRDFQEKTRDLGVGDLSAYYWYHTIDLGKGLVTPGDYDYRGCVSAFQFPDDMTGMNVLDVGSATGFFAFEFERRGAHVVSLELPSLADWDMITPEREQTLDCLRTVHGAKTLEQAHFFHLEGPFAFCRNALHSSVRRCYSRIYDLSPATLGVDAFDLIFVGDVLPHTWAPFPALDRLAALCRGTLIIAQDMAGETDERPLMVYIGGDQPNENRSWWLFNQKCLEQMLRKLGFKTIEAVSSHSGALRRVWRHYDRVVYHANR